MLSVFSLSYAVQLGGAGHDNGDSNDETGILTSCANGQTIKWNADTSEWECSNSGLGVSESKEIEGLENLITEGFSNIIVTINEAFADVHIGALLTVHEQSVYVIDKINNNILIVETFVDWNNAGEGRPFAYQNPIFELNKDHENRFLISAEGKFGIGSVRSGSLMNLQTNFGTPLSGTVTLAYDLADVEGLNTFFTKELSVGEDVKIGNTIYTITSVTSDTLMTIDSVYLGETQNNLVVYKEMDQLLSLKDGKGRDQFIMTKDGNFGIGITNPTQKLEIDGAMKINGNVLLNNNYISGDGDDEGIFVDSQGQVGIGISELGSRRLRIGGDFEIIGSCSGCGSDRNLKKDIQPLEGALSNIMLMQGISYQWKEGTEESQFMSGLQYGIDAQDLEEIYPELIGWDDRGYRFVHYQKLTVPLLEAIKEQQAQIEKLTRHVKKLTKRVRKLEGNEMKDEFENNNEKFVEICHYPRRRKEGKPKTILIHVSTLKHHLSRGNTEGPCGDNAEANLETKEKARVGREKEAEAKDHEVRKHRKYKNQKKSHDLHESFDTEMNAKKGEEAKEEEKKEETSKAKFRGIWN